MPFETTPRQVVVDTCAWCYNALNNITASLLVERWKRANELRNVATSDYSALISTLDGMLYFKCTKFPMVYVGEVSDKLVEEWIESEKHLILADEKFQPTRMYMLFQGLKLLIFLVTEEWKPHYFFMLQSYYITRWLHDAANMNMWLFVMIHVQG